MMDDLDLDLVRGASRDLAHKFDLEYWRGKDADHEYPWEFVKLFAEGGWLGAIVPEEYGGLGIGVTAAGVMLAEAAAAGGVSAANVLHYYVFPPGPIIQHGSEQMKREWLPQLASGDLRMAFGVTEPTAGVDTSRITTKATKVDGGWRLNGHKVWISNAQNAHRILLLARTSPRDDSRPLDGMSLFFAENDPNSITIREIDKLARNCIDSNELFIDNLFVRDEDVVGEVGNGFSHLISGLNPERIVVGFETVGAGRLALELATRYANERVVFDRPIGKNQAIAHPLAEAWIRLEGAELMCMRAAELYDAGQSCGPEANAAKFLASEAGFFAADRAMQTLGGYSYAKEYHVERLWRELRLLKIAPVSQEMVLNFISSKVLGLPRSY